MTLEIPGYYFDEQKGKYFKIQKSHLASGSSAAYSSDNVKRRKLEDEAHRAAEQRRRLLKNHIRRHVGLDRNRVAAAVLDREVGAPSAAGGVGPRLMISCVGGDKPEVWAAGLEPKGEVIFAPSFARERMANMNCFYVDGSDEKTGMGVAYGSLDGDTLVGSYVRTDANERITYARDSTHMPHLHNSPLHTEVVRCPQMSSIRYHKPSHKVLMTSRELDHSAGLYIFSPLMSQSEDQGQPQWLLGEADQYSRVSTIRQGIREQLSVHQATPAPESAPETLCVIGTNAGVLRVSSNEMMEWLAPPPASGPGRRDHQARKSGPKQQVPREIFDLDFDQGNPNVLYAGGRQARLWTTDMRTSGRDWRFANIPSSAAHVKSLNASEVLVSGPCDLLSIYDIRYLSSTTSSSSHTPSRPLLTFPSHSNKAHIHVGLDVSSELGVVAAAQGNGTIKMFSTTSGRVLSEGGSQTGLGAVKTDTPVKALQFRKMPWERWESLWVAEGPTLKKFSFGVRNWEDEA